MPHDLAFLRALLDAPGPSSFESRPAAVWRERAESYGAETSTDAYGSVFARFGAGGSPRVMLAGHIDEIGLMVTHVDDAGLVFVTGVGGWDRQQLVGQRVRLLGRGGDIVGVVGRKPTHLLKADEREKVVEMAGLWIDIGAKARDETLAHVRPGDVGVLEAPMIELLNGRIAARGLDNRIGAYIVLEAARRASAGGASAEVTAVATVQEEIGGVGAYAAAFRLEPDVAVAVDVTHAIDIPGADPKQHGETKLGSGPELAAGSYVHRGVMARLERVAEREGLPYTVVATPTRTATDADFLAKNRAGVPTAVVSIPNRYMHSPSEMIDPDDLEHTVALLDAFVRDLAPGDAFVQP